MEAVVHEAQWHVGDVVMLKSGSPKLTVSRVHGSPECWMLDVQWVGDGGVMQTAVLPAACVDRLAEVARA